MQLVTAELKARHVHSRPKVGKAMDDAGTALGVTQHHLVSDLLAALTSRAVEHESFEGVVEVVIRMWPTRSTLEEAHEAAVERLSSNPDDEVGRQVAKWTERLLDFNCSDGRTARGAIRA